MDRRRHFISRGPQVLVVALFATMILAGPTTATDDRGPTNPTSNTQEGWVLVPSHPSGRAFSASSLEGVTHEVVEVLGGSPFELGSAFRTEAGTCLLSACVKTADFDMAFVRENEDGTTTLLYRAATVGDEEGTVPDQASFGIVYLRTPGVVPELKGYRFAYHEGDG